MDRRDNVDSSNTYAKELEKERAEGREYDEYITEGGAKYRVPYRTVREVIFTSVEKEGEMRDTEHAARLQYRLMLQDAILFAKVEFVARKIKITYNPDNADNRKAKMSLQQISEFLAKEGVHVDISTAQQRDVDYYNEIYKYQYNPPSIREHPPYGYTLEEWRKGMKAEYESKKDEYEQAKKEKFHNFQDEYVREHPELAAELGIKIEPKKEDKSLIGRVLKKNKKSKDEKGFWFHGV